MANEFLRRVNNPKKWYDVEIIYAPEAAVNPVNPEETRKRPRRIFELERKQILKEIKVEHLKENKRRDEEIQILRAESQRRHRDLRTNIHDAVEKSNVRVKKHLENFLCQRSRRSSWTSQKNS